MNLDHSVIVQALWKGRKANAIKKLVG